MKKICNIFIFIFTITLIFLTIYGYIFNASHFLKLARKINYYDKVQEEVINNFNHIIINEDMKTIITQLLNREQIVADTNLIINSIFYQNDVTGKIKEDTKQLITKTINTHIQEYNISEQSINDLSENLTNTYINSLFPYRELNKIYIINTNSVPFFAFFLILMIILITLLSTIISKKRPLKIFYRSMLFTSFLLISLFLIFKLSNIFKDFYYTNMYFSIYLNTLINSFINCIGIIGIFIFLIIIIMELFEIKNSK